MSFQHSCCDYLFVRLTKVWMWCMMVLLKPNCNVKNCDGGDWGRVHFDRPWNLEMPSTETPGLQEDQPGCADIASSPSLAQGYSVKRLGVICAFLWNACMTGGACAFLKESGNLLLLIMNSRSLHEPSICAASKNEKRTLLIFLFLWDMYCHSVSMSW